MIKATIAFVCNKFVFVIHADECLSAYLLQNFCIKLFNVNIDLFACLFPVWPAAVDVIDTSRLSRHHCVIENKP